MGSHLLSELVGDFLRGTLNGDVARDPTLYDDRRAGQRAEPASAQSADEAWHERRAGQARHHDRRSEKPRLSTEKRDRYTVAPDVTVHQQRHETVLRKRPADLQWRVERLPHFNRLDADEIADPLADPVPLGIGLPHGGYRERQTQEPRHHHRPGFPVPVMAPHQDDAATFGVEGLQR